MLAFPGGSGAFCKLGASFEEIVPTELAGELSDFLRLHGQQSRQFSRKEGSRIKKITNIKTPNSPLVTLKMNSKTRKLNSSEK